MKKGATTVRRKVHIWIITALCGLGTMAFGSARRPSSPPTRQPIILIDFWATTCGPCRPTLTDLQKLHAHYPRLSVLGVAMDSADTAMEVRPLLRQQGITYPVRIAPDANQRMAQRFGVHTYPALFLLDAQGHVHWSHSGPLDVRAGATLSHQIAGLLSLPDGRALRQTAVWRAGRLAQTHSEAEAFGFH